jgi:YVTN family beta-propeller protein
VVANLKAETVDLVNARTDTKTASVAVGGPVVQVAVSPDGRHAFASVTQPPSVVRIDLSARRVTGRAEVSAAPAQVYLAPDGRTLLSADQGSQDRPGTAVSVIDTATMTVAGRIATGSGPHGVVVDPTGRRAWVTNVFDSTVSVIDLSTRTTVATIAVGAEPNGISYAARPPAPAAERMSVALPTPSATTSDSGSDSDSDSGHGHHDHG